MFAHHTPSRLTLQVPCVEVAFPACSVCPTGDYYLMKLAWKRLRKGAGLAYKVN